MGEISEMQMSTGKEMGSHCRSEGNSLLEGDRTASVCASLPASTFTAWVSLAAVPFGLPLSVPRGGC